MRCAGPSYMTQTRPKTNIGGFCTWSVQCASLTYYDALS
jgi:hypothetical protein